MTTVVLVGPRHRGPDVSVEEDNSYNLIFIKTIIEWCDKEYTRGEYILATVGCDKGFGKTLKDFCKEQPKRDITLLETIVYFNGEVSDRVMYQKAMCSRYAALVDLGDVFVVSWLQRKRTIMDDLVDRIRNSGKKYMLYDEANSIIEHRGFGPTEVEEKAS